MLDLYVFYRLAAAIGIGLIIGLQREHTYLDPSSRHPAGVRTFTLVSLAGAMAALLSDQMGGVAPFITGIVVIGMLLFFADTIFGSLLNGSGQYAVQATVQPDFADTIVLGNILALVSGVTFGLTTIFQRKQQLLAQTATVETTQQAATSDTCDSANTSSKNTNTTSDAFMIAQIITAAFGLIFVFTTDDGIPDSKSLLFLVLLGVFQMGIPNITYGIGIQKVRALSASLITMLEPLMNPIWVLIFVHEIPSIFSIIGGIIILGCILLREILSRQKNRHFRA